MRNIYKFLLFIFLNAIVIIANAQSTCATAITLTPGTQQCGTNSYVGSFPDDGTAPNNPCDNNYNDGEYWFKYVGTGKPLKLTVSGLSATYSGIYVLSACPASSPTCLAYHSNGSSTADYSVTTPVLTSGVTYYIVIANWSTPYSTNFCLDAVEIPTYNMTNGGNISSCAGIFMDPEGTANYADHNGTWTMTFCSNNGQALQFNFTEFETKEAADNLTIYDGPNTSSPSLGIYSQTNSPGTITSSGTCLTFAWTTDNNQAGTVGWTANFSCVPLPPPNNECINATVLTINSPTSCDIVTHGTTQGATASSQTNPCSGTADDDVWYYFTATSTTLDLSLLNITGSSTDMYFVVYSGNDCNNLTNILCSDPNSARLTGLTVGSKYYVRVYTYYSGDYADFDICLSVPPPPPPNDECSDAIALTINSPASCDIVTHGYTEGATASSQTNPCSGTADDDVWYYFTATNTTLDLSLLNITGSSTDMYFVVYSGNNCNNLTNILCSDPNSARLTGLTVGSKYYVRVYTYSSGYYANFDICLSVPPPPPTNDECSDAIHLSVNPDQNCGTVVHGSVSDATASPQTNPCYGTADDDIWYSFVATSTRHDISLLNITGSTSDMYIAVYEGSCGSLTNILCSDPEYAVIDGLTPGMTYYVRIYTWTSTPGQTSSFDICVGTPPPPGPGDLCSMSSPFCSDSTYNFPAGVNSGTGETGPDYCCLYTTPNPVWYYLRIDQPGDIVLDIHSNPQKDLDFICWGPFTNIDDPCVDPTTYLTNDNSDCSNHHDPGPGGGYPSGNTVDCSYDASYQEWCYIPNAQVGEFYILLITNYSNQPTNIIFEQISGGGATDCNVVICNMSSITATPTACNPSTNFYSISGTITFTDPPTSGQLIVTDNSGATQTFNPPFISPINYEINNINSDGATHTVTAQFTSSPSCTNYILYNAPPACNMCNADAGPDKTVCGMTTNLEAVINPYNASYIWSPTAGISFANVNSPTTSITATAPGVYTLTWNVTSTYGVTCTDQVTITFDNPTVTASASPSAICNGTTSTLIASGASTYSWSGGLGTGASKTVTPSSTTTYTVTGTSAAGCTGTATVSVIVNPLPTVTAIASPSAICNGASSTLTANGTDNYSWSTGGSTASITVTPSSTTTYTVTGTSAAGCTGTATVSVTVNPLPTVTAIASPSAICN
ncbi:MAG: large repetitive protein, partial [Rikenellaceae bacterium]|nr:large repetitive protein [Rikenellaceae bacterium]